MTTGIKGLNDKGKIYIAGPMSGYPEFNFPAFYAAEDRLRKEGWTVFNPADKDIEKTIDTEAYTTGDNVLLLEKGFDFAETYLWDVTKVIEADAIYMLPGWQYSPGAVGEHAVAVAMKKHYPDRQIIYGQESQSSSKRTVGAEIPAKEGRKT